MQPISGSEAKGLIASLFDFNFTSLITTKIIRIVYTLAVILISLFSVFFLLAGLAQGGVGAVLTLLFVPIGYLLYLILTRIWMEVLIVIFRIGDDIHVIRMNEGGFGGSSGGQNPQ